MKSPVVVLRRNWLQLLTYLIIFLASLLLVFFAGYYKAEYDLGAVLGGEESVVEKILTQQDEIQTLKHEKIKVDHDREIERQASKLLEQQFSTLKLEIDRLNRDLALYKSIVEPTSKNSGVYLKKLQVYPLDKKAAVDSESNPKNYHYQIILAQKSKQRSYTRGTVELRFILDNNESNGKIKVLDAKGKVINAKKYKFRYYQDIQGKIKVSAGVVIKQIKVIIKHSKQKFEDIEYVIDWQDFKEISYVGK